MTHYVIDISNSVWDDTDNQNPAAVEIDVNDSLILLETGFILATGVQSDAIYVNGLTDSAQVTINGFVSATRTGIYSLGDLARIVVNGQVTGGSTGVYVHNGGQIIINAGGSISGGQAVLIGADCTLLNNGTLTSF